MKNISLKIFRAYDIRGIYPKEINQQVSKTIAKAFFIFLKKLYKKKRLKIVVGRDNRISSPKLFEGIKEGFLEKGVEILDIGYSITPLLYFAVWKLKADGGIQITASHNPPNYNGMKLTKIGGEIVGENSGLKEIKKIFQRLNRKREKSKSKGKIKRIDYLEEYLEFNLKRINLEKITLKKVAFDTGNGVSGILVEKLSKILPFKTFHLFKKLDGNFPNHLPDPTKKENLKELQKFVRKHNCDLGVAFDGDGDRIVFLTEKGEFIMPDYITALISERILKKYPNSPIVYTICSSNIVKETIERAGGKAISSKVGHTFVKEKMLKENAPFGGEYSGHYFFKESNFSEAPLFVLFEVFKEISEKKLPFSKIIKPYKKYAFSGTINFKTTNKKKLLEKIEKKFKRKRKIKIDGVRIDFRDWWFLARPSNTEELVRIVLEAKTKKLMKEKLKEILTFFKKT